MTTKTPKSTSSSGSSKNTDTSAKSTDASAKSTSTSTKSTTKSSQSTKKSTKSTATTASASSGADVPALTSPSPAASTQPSSSGGSPTTGSTAFSGSGAALVVTATPPRTSTLPPGFVRVSARGHQLSIAGRVVDARTRKVIARAEIALSDGPEAWRTWLESSQRSSPEEGLDRTHSAADGTFRFVNLPEGRYTLTARLPDAGTRYGTVSLQLEVSSQRSPFPLTLLALPPTAVEGVVRGAGEVNGTGGTSTPPAPLAMARVRVMGSGESALTDADGRYLLNGIEPGTRTLQVSARGFQPAQLPAGVERGLVKSLDVQLERPPLGGKSKP